MKLKDLLKSFGGGVCVSVYDDSKDYCKEAAYDYYDLPKWVRSKAGLQEFLSDDNPNHYRMAWRIWRRRWIWLPRTCFPEG